MKVVCPLDAAAMARWILSSVALSMAEVESSRIRMRGSARKAREGETLLLPAGENHTARPMTVL